MKARADRLPRLTPGTRAFVTGPTGSGKSEFTALQLLQPLAQRIIAISPKRKFNWFANGARFERIATTPEELAQQIKEDTNSGFTQRTYRLFVPLDYYNAANIHKIDRVYEWALQLGDTCVVADDFYVQCGSSSSQQVIEKRLPHYLACVTQGRDPYNVTTVTIAQRPSNIPLVALTESDLRVTFFLREPDDQKCMDTYCGAVPWDSLEEVEHSFVWATDREQSTLQRLALPEPESLAIAGRS